MHTYIYIYIYTCVYTHIYTKACVSFVAGGPPRLPRSVFNNPCVYSIVVMYQLRIWSPAAYHIVI